MKILLDTMYFMPAIGVSVKGIPANAVIRLLSNGKQLAISELSLFELSAKGAKYASDGKIPQEEVLKGVRAIIHDEQVAKIPAYEEEQLEIAIELQRFMKDFIDCLIVSSALTYCDCLITEDNLVHDLRTTESYKQLITSHNSKFTIQKLSETLSKTA